jgi:Spy/CpxP family protein refolding chaperone
LAVAEIAPREQAAAGSTVALVKGDGSMKLVRIVLVMAVALAAAATVMAQEKEKKGRLNPVSRVMLSMERFRTAVESLDLTEDQKEKLKKIHEENGPKLKEILGKVHETLTEEQKKSLEDAMKTAKEAGKKGPEFFRSVEGAVKLTDEQKEKLEKVAPELGELAKETRKKVEEVLTPEQRQKLKDKMAEKKKSRKKSDS